MHQTIVTSTPAPRTAVAFEPAGSPVVHSIVTYRFGSCIEATRPDRVMRMPTAVILLQTRGMLLSRNEHGLDVPLPGIAMLGPSLTGQVWSTAPQTEFTLVNLAPGASKVLFGLDPQDLEGEVEALHAHQLAGSMVEHLARSPVQLHRYLCAVSGAREIGASRAARNVRSVLTAISRRLHGDHVGDYANRFGLSMRTLQRMVRAAVGLTPKQVMAVERVRRLVRLTAGGWSRTAADLAQAAGFFDQSHLRYDLLRQNFGNAGELIGGDHLLANN